MVSPSRSLTSLIAERFVEPTVRPSTGPRRMVAALRVVMVLFATAAVLSPLTVGYAVYAAALLAAEWWTPRLTARWGSAMVAADLLAIGVLLYLTGGAVSPLFATLVFVMFSATYLCETRGLLLTCAATIALYIAMGFLHDPGAQRPLYTMRIGLVIAVAIALTMRRTHELRTREELARFASWPRLAGRDAATTVAEMSSRLAELVRSPRVLIVWEEDEEPWLRVVLRAGGALDVSREGPAAAEILLPRDFSNERFVWRHGAFLRLGADGLERWPDVRWPKRFLARYEPETVLSLPLVGGIVHGRVYFLDGRQLTVDRLRVAEVAVRLVTADLEQQNLIARLYDSAAARERVRVARDLHDGLLQSLTAISLQLAALEKSSSEPHTVRTLRVLVEQDYRQLRAFVTGSRTSGESLERRLELIATGVEQRWSVAVALDASRAQGSIAEPLADEICSMVTEALSNAARHAAATRITAAVIVESDAVRIDVSDDGRGFPFRGRYDLDALARNRTGPRALRERVIALHGALVLDSSPTGAHISIRVPVPGAGEA